MNTELTVEVTFPGGVKKQVPAEQVGTTIGTGMMVWESTPKYMNGYKFHQLINRSWIAVIDKYDQNTYDPNT